ncbi:MAG: chitobiase/beta-hexosaminidase C-terminal domain-containing protein [Spirochaetes bacterium]|nr:chitobiase/beta-hexosaminidase C-terminal domain-containing protein [Spirochaetota bacterium]
MKTKIFFLFAFLFIFSLFYFGCPHHITPASENDNLCKKVATPTFSPEGGIYDEVQNVTISCSTKGVVIRYTDDGNDPDKTSTVYTNPITVDSSMTIKAIAYRSGWKDSDIAIAEYVIGEKVSTPIFSPPAGTYTSAQNIEINCSTSDAVITYTIDGSEPEKTSTEYTTPVAVDTSMTIRARAFKADFIDSEVAEAVYTITGKIAAPIFSISGGTYNEEMSVTLSCSTEEAVIRYTTDGSEPDELSGEYSTPINVNVSTTIKARAFKTDWETSEVAAAVYELVVLAPETNYQPTLLFKNTEIILSCQTPGATIKFTTDGSDPKESSTAQIGNSYLVECITSIKAYAFKNGWSDSKTIIRNYSYQPDVPTIEPKILNHQEEFICKISTITEDAYIKYTTDDTDPTFSPTAIEGDTILIDKSMNIAACAYKLGCALSCITSQKYKLKVKTPIITPNSGTYTSAQTINISCGTIGSTIKYTTDGTDPKTSDTALIGNTFTIDICKTIKAYAFKTGWDDSETVVATYFIDMVPSNIAYRDMVYVSGGTLMQLDTFENTISPYYIGKYEVTYELWYTVRIWAQNHGYSFKMLGSPLDYNDYGDPPNETTKYKPVDYIYTPDMVVWCNAYSEMSGLTPCFTDFYDGQLAKSSIKSDFYKCNFNNNGFRLPTEGEWEFAARYQDGTNWTPLNYASGAATYHNDINDINLNGIPDGKEANDAVAVYHEYWNGTSWCTTGVNKSTYVGTKLPNQLGIYDMSGNVVEVCYDRLNGPDYSIPTTPQINYRGPIDYFSPTQSVAKSCFPQFSSFARSERIQIRFRYDLIQLYPKENVGLRVARNAQ